MKALAERRLVQVLRRKPQAGCLVRLLLIDQSPDLKLKLRNSTLATVSPTIKGLCLLKELRLPADVDHLRTTCAFGQ